MMNSNRTAIEQRWMEDVIDFANDSSFLLRKFGGYCDDPYSYHIHHVIGAKAKRKVNFISVRVGEFYILPTPISLHESNSNELLNVTNRKNSFEAVFGTQKEIFCDMVECMCDMGYSIPFDDDLIEAL